MTIIHHTGRRSIRSWICEKILSLLGTKETYASYRKTEALIEQKSDTTYQLKKHALSSPYTMETIQGMQVYTINEQAGRQQQLLYVHGGGWMNPPLVFHWHLIDYLAKHLDARIIVPLYPKIPDHNYRDAYRQLLPLYRDLAQRNGRLTLIGDSAGGNIVLGLLQLLDQNSLPQPDQVILLSACVDMSFSNPDIKRYDKLDPRLAAEGLTVIAKRWAAGTDISDPLLSPINSTVKIPAKVYHFIGTHDILYPDAIKFHHHLKSQQTDITTIVYPKMNHVFPVMPIPEAYHARRQMLNIIRTGHIV